MMRCMTLASVATLALIAAAPAAAQSADFTINTALAGQNVPGSPATITGTLDYGALLNGGAGGSSAVTNFDVFINGTEYNALQNVMASVALNPGGTSGLLTFADPGQTLFSFNFDNAFAGSPNGLPSGAATTTNATSFNYNGTPITINAGLSGTANFSAAVPEPSTWALMLMGFGGMGVAMRRQRRTSALAQVA